MKRTQERIQFLSDLLITAIEHSGYGFSANVKYRPEPNGNPADTYAVIVDRYEIENWDGEGTDPSTVTFRVDLDTMAKGLGIIRKMTGDTYADWIKDLQRSDRTNGDDGDYDVIGALLVLECALFGVPTYS